MLSACLPLAVVPQDKVVPQRAQTLVEGLCVGRLGGW